VKALPNSLEPRHDEPLYGEHLNPKRAAKLLGVEPSTLHQWRCKRVGPSFYKVRGATWYLRDEVLSYIRASRVDCR
jgi:hypothetical protein